MKLPWPRRKHEAEPVEWNDEAQDVILELVPFLRHAPGCPTEKDRDDEACLCSLSATLDGLRDDHRVDVVACCGCGVHAINGDGTEDWAWMIIKHRAVGMSLPEPAKPYCHSCAVALGA